jgi:hypothetical protein
MKRRIFLGGLAAGLAGAVALGLVGPRRVYRAFRRRWQAWFAPAEDQIVSALSAALPHLRFPPLVAQQFVRAWREARQPTLLLPLPESVVVRFLLSTDFVQHRGDPERELAFTIFYDPYQAPCYNPFMLSHQGGAGEPSAFE